MTLLDRIKLKCKEDGISIRTLEEKSGFPYATIGKWEKQNPSYDKVLTVANCLQISIEWLITGNEPGKLTPEEQQLVELYRSSSATGRKLILNNAKTTSESLPAELQSSTCKIG